MLRLNLILLALIVASALGVVAAQHKSRKLVTEIEREQERMRALEVEFGQLQLEQSTQAAHTRVEKIARERLAMRAPAVGQVLAVDAPPAKGGK